MLTLTANGCWSHTFWVGLLLVILVFLGFKGCQSTEKLPCYIQAVGDEDVAVRVGPGTNRAIRFYLPDNDFYKVIGGAAADDGSDWWQIEIEDIPQAWVDQADVTNTGNCVAVQNADAPPIVIRSPQAPPTAPPAASGTIPPPPPDAGITYTPTEPGLNLPTLTASYTRTPSPGPSPTLENRY